MLKIGDTVKVIGKTIGGDGTEKEYFPIGSICFVLSTEIDKKGRLLVEISTIKNDDCGYWYLERDLEKGHVMWIKD